MCEIAGSVAHLSCSLHDLLLYTFESPLIQKAIRDCLHSPNCKGALGVVQVVVVIHDLPRQD